MQLVHTEGVPGPWKALGTGLSITRWGERTEAERVDPDESALHFGGLLAVLSGDAHLYDQQVLQARPGSEMKRAQDPGPSDTHYSILSALHGLAGPGEDAASVGDGQGVEQRESPPDDAVSAGYRSCGTEHRRGLRCFAGVGGEREPA